MMNDKDAVLGRISEALLCDYISVYYVDAKTDEYIAYTRSADTGTLKISQEGKDFFADLITESEKLAFEEDRHIFRQDIQKENLLREMKSGTMQDLIYRLTVNGKVTYHSLRLIRSPAGGDDYFILGVTNIDNAVRTEQETERLSRERRIYNQIAQSLASYYDTIYYVDSDTSEYIEFSATKQYAMLDIPKTGSDFFTESVKNIKKYIHPEDKERVLETVRKENLIAALGARRLYTSKYRLLINGIYRYTALNVMWASDRKHLIVGVEDIDERMRNELDIRELERRSLTYTQILNSLAYRYDSIYYIDYETGNYVRYTAASSDSSPNIESGGSDFFAEAPDDIRTIIHAEDCAMVIEAIKKENLIKRLSQSGAFSISFRQLVQDKYSYFSLRAALAEDKRHIILGLANIDEQIRLENEHKRQLLTVTEKALSDELTGVKNMNAYQETERMIQDSIDSGSCLPFALVLCDINDLKHINDTRGHKSGDEYIRSACRLLCSVFVHSPVYRIGGDEFIVILQGSDYEDSHRLFTLLRTQVSDNLDIEEAPILASGFAEYDPSLHRTVSEVFELADRRMYQNKKNLKLSEG